MKSLFLPAIALATCILFCQCANNNEQKTEETVKTFQKISLKELQDNPVKMVADDWLLLSAKKSDSDSFNMMTLSWGTIGNLWGEPVAIVYVRPQRYTYQFTEDSKYFTLTVFEEKDRDILQFCGTKSGREFDKVKETGLKPLYTELGNVYYEQARVVIECEKIYADFFKEEAFIDKSIAEKIYPHKDFHKMYVGKILNVWVKE